MLNNELMEYKKKYTQKSLETLNSIMVVKFNATEDLETERHGQLIADCQVK